MYDNSLSLAQRNGKTDNMLYWDYLSRLRQLATSVYKWDNLPDNITTRFIEDKLFNTGMLGLAHDNNLGFIIAPATQFGLLNTYDETSKYQLISNTYNKVFNREDIALCRNNIDSRPTIATLSIYAQRISNIDKTIDMNMLLMRKPYYVQCEESQVVTIKNMFEKIDSYEPLILGNKALSPVEFNIINADVPYNIDKLQDYKMQLWNECLTFLGINNVSTQKKERMVTDEVNANNESLELFSTSMLEYRQECCDEANKKWGLNIKVRLATEKEVNENGKIHVIAQNSDRQQLQSRIG